MAKWRSQFTNEKPNLGSYNVETLLQLTPAFAAAGYSLVYLLAGGGFFGAFVIFVVAKMLGR
jgi:hypothetical protein